MEKNGMFRVALFGGYNKEDVQEYIKTLENEIDAVKVLHQKEKNELLRRLEGRNEAEQTNDGEVARLRNELEQKEKELNSVYMKLESENSGGEKIYREDESNAGEVEKIRRELEQKEEELGSARKALEQKENELGSVRKELEERSEELKNLQEAQAEAACSASGEEKNWDSLEYEAITRVLEDARKNAEMIEADAHKNAEKILEKANEEIKEREKEMTDRMNAELVNKGIQLFAAKHKITHYMKEVKRIQESLYYVYANMNDMVETMPVRLDDYWAGENYKMLEEETENPEQESEAARSEGEPPEERNPEEGV